MAVSHDVRRSAFAFALAALASFALPSRAFAAPAAAAATASFWYAGTMLTFDRPQLRAGALAVGSDDRGLARFLAKLGATASYAPGATAFVVTGGDRRVVSFPIGGAQFAVDGVPQAAAFPAYAVDGVAYVPFLDLARALGVIAVDDATATVLEPQLTALDARPQGRATVVTFRGASPLHFKRVSDAADEQLSLAFTGIASSLAAERAIAGAGVRGVTLATGGTARNPTTIVHFEATPGGTHVLVPSETPNAVAIAFGPPGVTLGGTPVPIDGSAAVATAPLDVRDARVAAAAPPPAVAAPPARGGGATPTALTLPVATLSSYTTTDGPDGSGLHLQIAGDVTYEWHRLPDNRWYVDLKPATLAFPSQDVAVQNAAISSLRLKSFVGPNDKLPTVRVAMTLVSPRAVAVAAESGGLVLAIDRVDDTSAIRTASGALSGGKIVAAVPLPPPPGTMGTAPAGSDDQTGTDPSWKFAPQPGAGGNGKLIVIDPGHGGSDTGAMHNGLQEAALNLEISRRLRTLLVARGWQVKLTRDDDVDVYGANASAHDELQARDDVANAAGARLFISVHTNSFTSSGLNGTTTYYFNPDSYAFAAAVHARLAALPTKDDGIRKENFYVIHHAKMPSILVETAFLSNPADAAMLKSDAFLQNVAVSIADGVRDFASAQASSGASNRAGSDGQ